MYSLVFFSRLFVACFFTFTCISIILFSFNAVKNKRQYKAIAKERNERDVFISCYFTFYSSFFFFHFELSTRQTNENYTQHIHYTQGHSQNELRQIKNKLFWINVYVRLHTKRKWRSFLLFFYCHYFYVLPMQQELQRQQCMVQVATKE